MHLKLEDLHLQFCRVNFIRNKTKLYCKKISKTRLVRYNEVLKWIFFVLIVSTCWNFSFVFYNFVTNIIEKSTLLEAWVRDQKKCGNLDTKKSSRKRQKFSAARSTISFKCWRRLMMMVTPTFIFSAFTSNTVGKRRRLRRSESKKSGEKKSASEHNVHDESATISPKFLIRGVPKQTTKASIFPAASFEISKWPTFVLKITEYINDYRNAAAAAHLGPI